MCDILGNEKVLPTSVDINADQVDAVFIYRQFLGKTERDLAIERLELPQSPVMLKASVRLIRWYQRRMSPKLGNRCVFDPSCSHYAELALRKHGVVRGVFQTIKRLYRCRPANGGIDEPN